MKKIKRLVSLILTLVMVFSMSLSVAAAGNTYKITAPNNGHKYDVYQIFTGDYALVDGKQVLSNVKWGKNGTGTEGTAVDKSVLDELSKLNVSASNKDKLAEIKKYVQLDGAVFGQVDGTTALQVPGGYYLIKEHDVQTGQNSASTTFIVEVADNVTISPKTDVPEVEKKVKDINDTTDQTTSEWQDSADYDIGDKVPFLLKGTVATNFDDYTVYKFVFHDTLSKGLTLDATSIVVKIDNQEVDNNNYTVKNTQTVDGCSFEVEFSDLKKIPGVNNNSIITVEYTATLNEHAVIGSAGNPNKVYLEYSNNPNDTTGVETGTTPEDKVIVFTYKLTVNKKNEEKNPLNGAAFKLEKKMQNGTLKLVKEFTVAEEINTFEFTGLDDGTYILTETKTPSGYNTIEPIEFTVTASHDVVAENPTLISLIVDKDSISSADGTLTTDVVNQKGAVLPETGGIGTTIFYVLGAALVVGGAVVLVVRKRMNK